MREKILGNPQTFFVFCFILYVQREDAHIKPQLKVELEYGRVP